VNDFTHIKGLSDLRRLPRLGKIRLGIKGISQNGKTFPREVDYFVCPEEVRRIHGLRPKELDILFPLDQIEKIFPQRYELYGSSRGLRCMGDGERGSRKDEKTGARVEIKCPCALSGKGCSKRGHLFFILPRVSFGGVYQLDVGSFSSIININSGLDYVRALLGRFSGIPFKLRREPEESHRSGVKEIHYPLKLIFEGNLETVRALRSGGGLLIPEHIAGIRSEPAAEEGDDFPSPEEELEQARKRGMVTELR
jgi:hypothetical protein